MKFGYQAEKFSAARRNLMLPHPQGEAQSIAGAFHECWLGLKDLQTDNLEEGVRNWLKKLKEFMDTSGIEDMSGRGKWELKAEQMTEEQKLDLSRVIDELAHWFYREFYETKGK
jgi:hypothetical protein